MTAVEGAEKYKEEQRLKTEAYELERLEAKQRRQEMLEQTTEIRHAMQKFSEVLGVEFYSCYPTLKTHIYVYRVTVDHEDGSYVLENVFNNEISVKNYTQEIYRSKDQQEIIDKLATELGYRYPDLAENIDNVLISGTTNDIVENKPTGGPVFMLLLVIVILLVGLLT